MDEDCLTLNIWSPTSCTGNCPVMTFIHGGSFVFGSGAEPTYDGQKLAAEGVVLVTINYRLGILGFLAHPALIAADDAAVNFGLQDQQEAMRWVFQNIGAFGGDSSRITLFGESAGSMSISAHIMAPTSYGLFRRAILESGTLHQLPYVVGNLQTAEGVAMSVTAQVQCADVDCMRAIPWTSLVGIAGYIYSTYGFNFQVVYDGVVVPTDPLQALNNGQFKTPIDVLIGINSDEGTYFTSPSITEAGVAAMATFAGPFAIALRSRYTVQKYGSAFNAGSSLFGDVVFVCPVRSFVQQLFAQSPARNLYVYEFAQKLSWANCQDPTSLACATSMLGVFHSSELGFVFGNFPVPFSQSEAALSSSMRHAWVRFAATGTMESWWPRWTPTLQSYAFLKAGSQRRVKSHFRSTECSYLEPFPFAPICHSGFGKSADEIVSKGEAMPAEIDASTLEAAKGMFQKSSKVAKKDFETMVASGIVGDIDLTSVLPELKDGKMVWQF